MNSFSSAPSTNILSIDLEVEDMQIDVVQYKIFTTQEKKRRLDEDLYLSCRGLGHKATKCHKKKNQHTFKMRSAPVMENKDAQP